MKNTYIFLYLILLSLLLRNSEASVSMISQNDWKIFFSGFFETSLIFDTTKSFREAPNGPVARKGTINGDSGRTQLSVRDSRFVLSISPPEEDNIKQHALFAVDFLGYNPSPSTSAPTNTESFFYLNPTPRLVLAFYNIEYESWQLLAGLSGSLFGWAPHYFLSTVSSSPIPGTIYLRTPQITLLKNLSSNKEKEFLVGVGVSRPTQRDSAFPNIDSGIRYIFGEKKAAFASAGGEVEMKAASGAISGTVRKFKVPSSTEDTNQSVQKNGSAMAFDTMIPIFISGSDYGNSLMMSGEYSIGKGYSEFFLGSTGNISQLSNLDPGLGGYDDSGQFSLTKLQTFNFQLQYHLPASFKMFTTMGYAQWLLRNPHGFKTNTGLFLYDKSQSVFGNVFHDFTKNMRMGIEYARFSTRYLDGEKFINHRIQFSTWFKF